VCVGARKEERDSIALGLALTMDIRESAEQKRQHTQHFRCACTARRYDVESVDWAGISINLLCDILAKSSYMNSFDCMVLSSEVCFLSWYTVTHNQSLLQNNSLEVFAKSSGLLLYSQTSANLPRLLWEN
jgi:hypothetical protein